MFKMPLPLRHHKRAVENERAADRSAARWSADSCA
jgi:hypothetical protein